MYKGTMNYDRNNICITSMGCGFKDFGNFGSEVSLSLLEP